MPPTGKPASRHVAAVERAVALLDALADAGEELGTNELARRTALHPSSVSRLLATLVAAGLVEHVEASGRYRLGLRLLELGNALLARLDLRAIARPQLAALVAETGETATLSAPGDPDAVTVDFVQSGSSVQSVARLGRPSVAHATATGKVALAFGGVALPSGRLERFTGRTIVARETLAAEVERVRAQGWARALGEREEELNALAAPVWGSRGELTAILGLQGPAPRFGEAAMARAVEPLLARAAAVSNALGWRRPDEEGS
ncbi:MAG TPA: IclR family transcriptional regulator [Gaiellaceae bacterium]|nr:IclR family transcriptional regulator [Gaiellaceae bacterium]